MIYRRNNLSGLIAIVLETCGEMTDMPENLDRPFRLSNTRLRNAAGFRSLGLSSKTRNARTTMGIEARTIGLRLGVVGVGLLLLCALASSSMAASLTEAVAWDRHDGNSGGARRIECAQMREQISRRLDEVAARQRLSTHAARSAPSAGSGPKASNASPAATRRALSRSRVRGA